MDALDSVVRSEYSLSRVRLHEYADLPFLWLECVSGSTQIAASASTVRLALTGATAVVAQRGAAGRIIGFVVLRAQSVVLLCVRPAFRRQGVASALLQHVVRHHGATQVDDSLVPVGSASLYGRCGLRLARQTTPDRSTDTRSTLTLVQVGGPTSR